MIGAVPALCENALHVTMAVAAVTILVGTLRSVMPHPLILCPSVRPNTQPHASKYFQNHVFLFSRPKLLGGGGVFVLTAHRAHVH